MSDINISKEPIPAGMGHAAFLLMIGLLSRLKTKGVLSEDDTKLIIDEAMLGLEQWGGLAHPDLMGAHSLLEALMQILGGAQHPPKPPASFFEPN